MRMQDRSAAAMAEKSVLISYLDSKKAIKLPEKEGLEFLKEAVMKSFSFERKARIEFQRFNAEWDEYVDLDELDDINHKDKLKVVVTCFTSSRLSTDVLPPVEASLFYIAKSN